MHLLLPSHCSVVQEFGPGQAAPLLPEEALIARGFSPVRRTEFAQVRRCAREALASLGVRPLPILPDPARAPRWPPGIVGSMTHCEGYRAAAVAWQWNSTSLGIDAEPNAPLPRDVVLMVSSSIEREHLRLLADARPCVSWDRLLFCAKEAVYKSWYPIQRQWLEFSDVAIQFDPFRESFSASLQPGYAARLRGESLALSGRWARRQGLLLAAAVITQLER
jgi:4'-phosphopantetheinyl transferase EntD